MKKTIKFAIASCFAVMTAQAATAAVIDFEGLDSSAFQDVPLMEFIEDGFRFELTFTRVNGGGRAGIAGPAIFDSANPVNGDSDLSPIAQGNDGISGNILILQEEGSNVPDDAAAAGTITLTLREGPAFRFNGASAIDNTDFTFSSIIGGVTTELGTIDIGSIEGDEIGGTGQLTFASASGIIGVGDSIFIEIGGSGGVDSLQISAVPVPAALPLLLAGVGGLGLMKRRKKKAAQA